MLGDPSGLDGHEGSICRAHGVDGFESGVDRREWHPSVEQEHLDKRPRAARVAELASRPGPKRLMCGREHAPLTGLMGREGTGHRAWLAGQDLQIVVEHQGLAAPDRAALVGGDDCAAIDDLDTGATDPSR